MADHSRQRTRIASCEVEGIRLPVTSAFRELDSSAIAADPDRSERWVFLLVSAISFLLLATHLNRGWFPHDEGALGQAAERVLRGEVPHRDFDEIYTGLLTYLHAAAFKVFGVRATSLRLPLFACALLWMAATYRIARRFMPALGAGMATISILVWSVPNYPAPMPSWYNLFFATFGVLALLRWHESSEKRWLLVAGVAGGVSFLFKLSGIFFLLGGGLALVAASPRGAHDRSPEGPRVSAWLVTGALVMLGLALAVPLLNAGFNASARFLLPMSLVLVAIARREWIAPAIPLRERLWALLNVIGPYALGAAIPLTLFVLLTASASALESTMMGVLVTPFRRVASAAVEPPGPGWNLWSVALGILLLPRRWGVPALWIAAPAAVILAIVAGGARIHLPLNAIGWYAVWGLPLVTAVAAGVMIGQREDAAASPRARACTLAIVATCTMLIEFPFAAPVYTLYALPLTILALAAIVRAVGRTAPSLQLTVAGFVLAFGVMSVLPGSLGSLGHGWRRSADSALLDLPRGGLSVRADDAQRYRALITFVREKSTGRQLWAGPDSPEVYFLSGIPNRTRTLFDFLDADEAEGKSWDTRLLDERPTIVVINIKPGFSEPPDSAGLERLRARYPHERSFTNFVVLWQ